MVAEKEEQKNTGGEYCSRRFFKDLDSLEELALKAAGSVIRGIITALNGEGVLQGASFLKDSMNKSFTVPTFRGKEMMFGGA